MTRNAFVKKAYNIAVSLASLQARTQKLLDEFDDVNVDRNVDEIIELVNTLNDLRSFDLEDPVINALK